MSPEREIHNLPGWPVPVLCPAQCAEFLLCIEADTTGPPWPQGHCQLIVKADNNPLNVLMYRILWGGLVVWVLLPN